MTWNFALFSFWLTDRPKDGLWVNAITCAEIAPVGCCLGEPTCNSSSVQGHTDKDMLTIHHSSNQPFTAIKIPWHPCVEQVNNEISGLSSLRRRCAVRLCMSSPIFLSRQKVPILSWWKGKHGNFYLNILACNMQARPWYLISILGLLIDK